MKKSDKPLRIWVTGVDGRLGKYLVTKMGCLPMTCDITNDKQVYDQIRLYDPDVIINCAGITDVDECEQTLYNCSSLVNGVGAMLIRQNFDGYLIHLSTDYVFDGTNGPYSENAKPNPINQYGKSKLLGEEYLLELDEDTTIVRTTILYGGNKQDFVYKVLGKLRQGKPFHVSSNLSGSPTYVPRLATALIELTRLSSHPKIINIAGEDCISRYEFALMIASVFGYDKELIHPTTRMDGVANRPKKAGLKVTQAKKLGLSIGNVIDDLKDLKEQEIWKHYQKSA